MILFMGAYHTPRCVALTLIEIAIALYLLIEMIATIVYHTLRQFSS